MLCKFARRILNVTCLHQSLLGWHKNGCCREVTDTERLTHKVPSKTVAEKTIFFSLFFRENKGLVFHVNCLLGRLGIKIKLGISCDLSARKVWYCM